MLKCDLEALQRHVNVQTLPRLEAGPVDALRRGGGCKHDTRGNPWYLVLTDGKIEVVREAAKETGPHINRQHVGCPVEPDQVLVHGGTFVVQYETTTARTWWVVLREDADLRRVATVVLAQHDLVKLQTSMYARGVEEEFLHKILNLVREEAEGQLLPSQVQHLKVIIKQKLSTWSGGHPCLEKWKQMRYHW
jgi:hypothetical protein